MVCDVDIDAGNKIDRAGAASEDELRGFFGLYGQTTGKVGLTGEDSLLSRYCNLAYIRSK